MSSQCPDGVGVHHEPDELSEQLRGPAEADGPGCGDTPAGGRHLGSLLWADLSKDTVTLTHFYTPGGLQYKMIHTCNGMCLETRGPGNSYSPTPSHNGVYENVYVKF